jgi:hypothetical protein
VAPFAAVPPNTAWVPAHKSVVQTSPGWGAPLKPAESVVGAALTVKAPAGSITTEAVNAGAVSLRLAMNS